MEIDMKKLFTALCMGAALSAAPVAGVTSAEPVAAVVAVEEAPSAGCYYKHWSYNVERWHASAIAQGWTECQWYRLSCVIYRESRGNQWAYNRYDPRGGSIGLVQINGIHWTWMMREGVIRYPYDLYTGWRNLRAARALYVKAGGWSPWGWCG